MEFHNHSHGEDCHHCHHHPEVKSRPSRTEVEEKVRVLQAQKDVTVDEIDDIGDSEEIGDWTEIYRKCALLEDVDKIEEELQQEKQNLARFSSNPQSDPYATTQGHDHSAERHLLTCPLSDQFRKLSRHLREGKMYFQEGQLLLADQSFQRGLVLSEYMFPESRQDMIQYAKYR